ncbi:MAG TPA: N-acetylmuramoyl-L-alanine amidase, partial [Steroidobacteraceae bacterium]|nr:N-acetylmuramoyl-L-alanine amidase [Steroidobacteraceae bacterium]
MIRKIFRLSVPWLLACAAASAHAAGTARLDDVRFWNAPHALRLVLELSQPTEHELFSLENPNRIVVDLTETDSVPGLKLPAATGPIVTLRTGAQADGTLRLVIETSTPVTASTAWIEPSADQGHRLIVTLGGEPSMPPRAVRAAHAPADIARAIVVAIDAGHGGKDPGAIGRSGTREKDVVLAIARALARRIDAEPGMRAVLTRGDDKYLAHRERIRRARAGNADLFVSIHADAILNREVSGSSVYVLSERGATDEAARWLAERENASDLVGGVSLDDKDSVLASVLLDLSQSASLSSSMVAAERVLASLDRVGQVRKPRVQQAGFLVLKSPDIASMLIETAYISNPAEEKRLRTETHQRKLAGAIFSGVREYFVANPPQGTQFAQQRRGGSGA